MANVFISHSSADNQWAEKVQLWLKQDGHDVFFDQDEHDGLIIGDEWERRLYERLRWADAVVCIVTTKYGESVWCAAEIGAARALGIELLPVRVGPTDERHKLLKTIQGVDAAKDEQAAQRVLRARLQVISGGGGLGWQDGKSPYPGLRAFQLDEHRVFFGRAREITGIAERLRRPERAQPAIFTVVGPSGCGKSSLIRAGVLPRIAGEDNWLPLPPMVPGNDPLGGLVRAIAAVIRERQIPFDVSTLRDDIDRDGLLPVANDLLVAAGAATTCQLLIVVDQFEELLTQTEPAQRARFAAALAPAMGGPIQVLATLRPEYLDAVSRDPDLSTLALRMHQVRPLDAEALRAVIEQPAKVAGLDFEDGLVARLIDDTGTGDALPLLAFTLEQLAHGLSRGDALTHRRYDDIGGVQGALQRQADEALAAACGSTGMTEDRVLTELIDLVTIDEHGRRSRRRLALDGAHHDCLQPFLDGRLLSTETDGKATLITVSHDSFLANWPPLSKEIDAQVTALRARRAVENAAQDWEAGGRDSANLLQGKPLTKAMVDTGAELRPDPAGTQRHWWQRRRSLTSRVDLADSARQFLTASADAERTRRVRRVGVRTAVMATLAVIAAVAIGMQQFAVRSEREAIAQRLIAESQVALTEGVNAPTLQKLLAGRSLRKTFDDSAFYSVVINSASTAKIMENPVRDDGEGLIPVQSVAVSAAGDLIASGSNDNKIRLWNIDSGALAREIELAGPGPVWSLAFDPAGNRLAVGSNGKLLQVFNAHTGESVGPVMEHPASVSSVAFGGEGQWIATGDGDGTVRVWDWVRGRPLRPIPADVPGRLVKSVAFSPDGRYVAAAMNNYGVRLFDARSGDEVGKWPGNYLVMSLAFNEAGDRLVAGGMGGAVDVLDGRTLDPIGYVQAHPGRVNTVSFSTDGARIVTGGDDNVVKVWDAQTLEQLGAEFRGHGGSVTGAAFTPDGLQIVSGSADGTVREWNTLFGLNIPAKQGAIRAVAFSPDNQTVASGGSDGTVHLWNARTATYERSLGSATPSPTNGHAINAVTFDKDGNRILTAGADGRVALWDTRTGLWLADLLPMRDPSGRAGVQSVAFDRDGRYIAAGGFDGTVRLWNASTLAPMGTRRAEFTADGRTTPYQVWSVAFSPDGDQLVTGSGFDLVPGTEFDVAVPRRQSNVMQLWNVESLTPAAPAMRDTTSATIYTVGFDPTGDHVVSGSSDGAVRVWDLASGTIVPKPLFRDPNPVYSLALAHRDRWMATGGGGGVVRVWDMEKKPEKDSALKGEQWVLGVAISPDDSLIVSGSTDGKLRLWPGPGDVGEILCSKLTANASQAQWNQWVGGKSDYRESCPRLT